MNSIRQYSTVIGVMALALVVTMLVSPIGGIFASQATFIGAELHRSSGNEVLVRTKMDFGNIDHLREFPIKFDYWYGLEFSTASLEEALNADLILFRRYIHKPEYQQPVELLIMQSNDVSSFHPPPVCYQAEGYQIEEEGVEEIQVDDSVWINGNGFGNKTGTPVTVSAKSIVLIREVDGEIREHLLALYFYVKGQLFENNVTLVRVSAEIPKDESYEKILAEAKGFMGDVIPHMFEPASDEGEMLGARLAGSWYGIAIMVILVMIPIGIIAYPKIRRSRDRIVVPRHS